jgi:hypothetical protein
VFLFLSLSLSVCLSVCLQTLCWVPDAANDRVNPGYDIQRTVSWGPDTRTGKEGDIPRTVSYPGLEKEDNMGSSMSLHSSEDSGEYPVWYVSMCPTMLHTF